MTRSRACDPCATRKIKCDRGQPCKRCKALDISCTTTRAQSKPGPKGPWAEKRRLARLQGALHQGKIIAGENALPISAKEESLESDESVFAIDFTPTASISVIQHYLDIYHERLYPVWPVVDRDEMNLRIQNPDDVEAYALCTALAAVVMANLRLNPPDPSEVPDPVSDIEMASESERARASLHYQEEPTIGHLLSSFFLHIFCANRGQVCKATVLIREAVTFAQFLELDQRQHYDSLPKKELQAHLRIIWILCITERGHTTRFDLSRILHLDPDLPSLETKEVPPGLVAFTDMCQLFRTFGLAMDSELSDRTSDFFCNVDRQLREMRQIQSKREFQQADFLITQQWMRMVLWKTSMFHIKLSADANDENLSILFPQQVAQSMFVYLNRFSPNIVEAHGIGMQMKLADVAISLADMLSCIPWMSERRQAMRIGPNDMLGHMANFLASLRGNINPRMEILVEKLSNRGWGYRPEMPIQEYTTPEMHRILAVEYYEKEEESPVMISTIK